MRFQDLNEDGVANFADQASDALNRIGDLAGKAYSKFRATTEKGKERLKKERDDDENLRERIKNAREDVKDAEADVQENPSPTNQRVLDKAQTELKNLEAELALPYKERAAFAKSVRIGTQHDTKVDKRLTSKEKAASKEATKGMPVPMIVATVIMSRTPAVDDLDEFSAMDAAQINNVQLVVDQMQSRFDKFSKRLSIGVGKSDLVNAQEKDEVTDRMSDQNDRVVESSEAMLMQNKNGEQDAWMIALTNEDPEIGVKGLVSLVRKISEANKAKNLARMTTTKGAKSLPEGLNLLNMLGAQRQIIELRLGLLKAALLKLEHTPITTEQLKRVRKLVKRL